MMRHKHNKNKQFWKMVYRGAKKLKQGQDTAREFGANQKYTKNWTEMGFNVIKLYVRPFSTHIV